MWAWLLAQSFACLDVTYVNVWMKSVPHNLLELG